jgi:hypothetical protein
MDDVEEALSRYLAEWYTPRLSGRPITDIAYRVRRSLATMPGGPHPPELLYAVEVPQDCYAFGVFAAESADVVMDACRRAGLPAERVTAASEAPPSDTTA